MLPVCEMHEFIVNFSHICEIYTFCTLMKFTTYEIHHEFTSKNEFTICESCEIHHEFTTDENHSGYLHE